MSAGQKIINYTGDGVSAAAIVGAFMGYLPALAAVAAIVWYMVQIYESKTVQKWVRLQRVKKRFRRLAMKKALFDDKDSRTPEPTNAIPEAVNPG